jgi:hypothetical protein
MAYNSNSAVWMACIVLLESQSGTHFQFLFGCTNHEIGYFLSLDNIQLLRTYINSRISNIKMYRLKRTDALFSLCVVVGQDFAWS